MKRTMLPNEVKFTTDIFLRLIISTIYQLIMAIPLALALFVAVFILVLLPNAFGHHGIHNFVQELGTNGFWVYARNIFEGTWVLAFLAISIGKIESRPVFGNGHAVGKFNDGFALSNRYVAPKDSSSHGGGGCSI